MAITQAAIATGTHNTSASSFTLTPGATGLGAGWIFLHIGHDNLSNTRAITNVTDALGNTWYEGGASLPGQAAAAFAQNALWYTNQNKGQLVSTTTITVTLASALTAKTWQMRRMTPSTGNTIWFQGNAAAGGTAVSDVTCLDSWTDTPVGICVVQCVAVEYAGVTWTLNNSGTEYGATWQTIQNSTIGSTTSGIASAMIWSSESTSSPTTGNGTFWGARYLSWGATSRDCMFFSGMLLEIPNTLNIIEPGFVML
jgi:hypothetical protein